MNKLSLKNMPARLLPSVGNFLRYIFFACSTFLMSSVCCAQMITSGQFQVGDMGAATYSIPIQTPPGISGVELNLSLSYNSQSGNGLLGVGWGLSGLGTVGRCPRTQAQDGVRGGVNYDANDRYCLDGQRLIAISGTNGSDGTEYRTERESFAKIVSYGSAGNGPASFKVWTKAGQVMYYGATTDSRIEALGKTTVRSWALNRIEDTVGNYLTVTYTKDTVTGDFYPLQVSYAGNSKTALLPANSIRFFYEDRPDIGTSYIAGSLIKNTKRLIKVSTYQASTPVMEYQLAYEAIASSGDKSSLKSITQCQSATGTCLAPLSISKLPKELGYTSATGWQSTMQDTTFVHSGRDDGLRIVDLNGDGLPDLLLMGYYLHGEFGGGMVQRAYINTGSGFVRNDSWVAGLSDTAFVHSGQDDGLRIVDLNGDGLPDLIQMGYFLNGEFGGGKVQRAYINTGSGFVRNDNWVAGLSDTVFVHSGRDDGLRIVDLNGDGLPDLLLMGYYLNGEFGGGTVQRAYINTGSGFVRNDSWVTGLSDTAFVHSGQDDGLRIVDLNGDGLPDLIQMGYFLNGEFGGGQVQRAYINTGSGFVRNDSWVAGVSDTDFVHSGRDDGLRMIDLNGDGLPDLLLLGYFRNGEFGGGQIQRAYINTGSGFVRNDTWISGLQDSDFVHSTVGTGMQAVDLNGDGLPDLVLMGYFLNGEFGGGQIQRAYINTGSGFVRNDAWISGLQDSDFVHSGKNAGFEVVDLNGDGIPDFILAGNYANGEFGGGNVIRSYLSKFSPVSRFVSTLQVAGGGSVAVDYAKPAASATYTKDSGANMAKYPQVDILPPVHVAALVKTANGIGGGTTSTNYTYGGLKAESGSGRGLLGFRWMQAKQVETGLTSYTEYLQSWPYTGLVSVTRKTLLGGGNAGVLSQANNIYSCNDPSSSSVTACTIGAGKRYFVYANRSVESSWDYNGAVMPVITTTTAYDNWGNATTVNVSTSDGYSKSTVNSYNNDSSNWYLGRLLRSSVTSTSP